jgi:hypothetical protein
MRTLLITAALVATLAIRCPAQFFPKSSLGTDAREDSFKSRWYSSHLRALNEPSLLELAKKKEVESYRFLWLRSFHHPVAIRLEIKGDGSSVLITKISSGAGGYTGCGKTPKVCRTVENWGILNHQPPLADRS